MTSVKIDNFLIDNWNKPFIVAEAGINHNGNLDNALKMIKIAKNAGFSNYRDYMFVAMGRFDYTPKDCFNFHDAIAQEIVPIINSFEQKRKDKLGYTSYKPWDTAVDVDGLAPLKPFEGGTELINLSAESFNRLRPYF